MRYIVFRENTEPLPNVYVPLGSLKPRSNGPIDVVWANAVGEPAIGRAIDFQRDETGAISFDIEFRPDLANLDAREECFSIYAKDLVQEKREDRIITLDATIMQIYFMPLPGFPKAKSSQKLQGS
jgi:hypothetical protein